MCLNVQCRVYFLCPDLWFRHLGNKWLDLTPGSYAGSRDQVRDHNHPRSSLVLYGRGLWMRQAGSLWHKRAGVATPWKYFSSITLSTNAMRGRSRQSRPMRVLHSVFNSFTGQTALSSVSTAVTPSRQPWTGLISSDLAVMWSSPLLLLVNRLVHFLLFTPVKVCNI